MYSKLGLILTKLPSYVTYKGLTQGREEGEDEDVNKLS